MAYAGIDAPPNDSGDVTGRHKGMSKVGAPSLRRTLFLVMSVYLQALEIKLPRNSRKQAEFCKTIPREKAVAGDLVFFATGKDPSRISHVGMLVDNEQFIHASSSKGVVVSSLDSPYYSKRIICFGRVPALERMMALLLLEPTLPGLL